ncbi:hypothetical protein PGTUg99_001100 [Puccinia graminis f. sp. tritici]|uniref:Uncharacterized protein n=1 Tax=Puccinia graminis f. sp. tritici TaxID=56615 RepID=A0A5B0QZ70_PUCGR|nr:hypothetical protein PGTUg99_001100 [Puccinia graminis f. sp. tritici]
MRLEAKESRVNHTLGTGFSLADRHFNDAPSHWLQMFMFVDIVKQAVYIVHGLLGSGDHLCSRKSELFHMRVPWISSALFGRLEPENENACPQEGCKPTRTRALARAGYYPVLLGTDKHAISNENITSPKRPWLVASSGRF